VGQLIREEPTVVEVELNGKKVELTMDRLFGLASQFKASDLHLKDGMPPTLRIDGSVRPTSIRPLVDAEIRELALGIMDDRLRTAYEETGNVDFAHALPSGDRFRINVFRQRGKTSLAGRRVIRKIPSFEELHLPGDTLSRLCMLHQGLIIFCGQSGCGKSTSIAACLDHVNRHRACHIVTVEDPIEYLHEDKKAFVSQREVGTDVESMERALEFLMREDPDVVLVGEMRNRDTFEAAIRAAETGHLVFATLHASSPGSAIGRILDLYPDDLQNAVRQNIAFNLAGIICQILVPACLEKVKRVPAVEMLVATGMIRKLIRDGEDEKLEDVIKSGGSHGMKDFTASFAELVDRGWVKHQTAYEFAPNQDAVRMALKGIAVKQGIIR
jgi:twitching motility protein PilT